MIDWPCPGGRPELLARSSPPGSAGHAGFVARLQPAIRQGGATGIGASFGGGPATTHRLAQPTSTLAAGKLPAVPPQGSWRARKLTAAPDARRQRPPLNGSCQ